MEKVKNWFHEYLAKWPADAVMIGLWFLLEGLACLGFSTPLLFPLYYLTGALAGIVGGSVLGGILGRGVILLFLRESIWTLCFGKAPVKERIEHLAKRLKSMLYGVIPYLADLKDLITKDLTLLAIEGFGLSLSVLLSIFLSGDGRIVNSFASLILFVSCTNELQTYSGLLFKGWNALCKALGRKEAESNLFETFISAHALGYLLGPALCAILPGTFLINLLAWILAAVSVGYLLLIRFFHGKTNA